MERWNLQFFLLLLVLGPGLEGQGQHGHSADAEAQAVSQRGRRGFADEAPQDLFASIAALKVWDLQCEANAADLRAQCSDVRLNATME